MGSGLQSSQLIWSDLYIFLHPFYICVVCTCILKWPRAHNLCRIFDMSGMSVCSSYILFCHTWDVTCETYLICVYMCLLYFVVIVFGCLDAPVATSFWCFCVFFTWFYMLVVVGYMLCFWGCWQQLDKEFESIPLEGQRVVEKIEEIEEWVGENTVLINLISIY